MAKGRLPSNRSFGTAEGLAAYLEKVLPPTDSRGVARFLALSELTDLMGQSGPWQPLMGAGRRGADGSVEFDLVVVQRESDATYVFTLAKEGVTYELKLPDA